MKPPEANAPCYLRSPVRPVDVVVDAGCGQLASLSTDVDSYPCLWWEHSLAPPHDVVLQRACAVVVDERAELQRDAAAVREQKFVERA